MISLAGIVNRSNTGDKLISKIISNYNTAGIGGTDSANEINKIKDTIKKGEVSEKWSEKYKKSIDWDKIEKT